MLMRSTCFGAMTVRQINNDSPAVLHRKLPELPGVLYQQAPLGEVVAVGVLPQQLVRLGVLSRLRNERPAEMQCHVSRGSSLGACGDVTGGTLLSQPVTGALASQVHQLIGLSWNKGQHKPGGEVLYAA